MRQLRQAHVPPPITPGVPGRGSLRGGLWQDLRYAARALRRQPGFAAVAILTLALGIGANSAIFALVDATLLRPLPFGNPDRLVMLSERSATSARGAVSPLNMTDWNERNRTFDVIAGYVPTRRRHGHDRRRWPRRERQPTVGHRSASSTRSASSRSPAGRSSSSDDVRGANVAVLSETFWRSALRRAIRSIVGRELRFDGMPFTVVGVVPAEFQLLGGTSMWAILPITRRAACRFEGSISSARSDG